MALDLAGQLNECKVTENPVLVSVLYQKNKNKNQDQNIFSLLSKRNKFENKKSMFLKVPSVPKGRGWGSSIFVFFFVFEPNYVNKVSSEPQIQWILWLIIEFFENSELSKRSLKFSVVLLRSAY